MKKDVVFGIDIGGTYTKYGIVDKDGKSYREDKMSTSVTDNVEEYLDYLCKSLNEMLNSIEEDVVLKGIGIGAPNGNYHMGTIEHAPNLQWKGIVPFTKLMSKYFDVPIVLTNDANAATIGEMVYGSAKNMKDFIVITLGTGLGSGLVVNGRLVYGHDGFAGELGHTIVKLSGRQCGCGRRGCLETYVSATGIKRTIFKLLSENTIDSDLRYISFDKLESKMIHQAAMKGDKIALQAFDFTAQILASKLADAVAHTSPEAIFLLGGLAKSGDYLFEPTRIYLEKKLFPIYKNKIKLLPSGLTDKNAAVMGAAGLIWKEIEMQ